MNKEDNLSRKFVISLRENGLHSLWKGIEAYAIFDETQDKLSLKDAIMFLHHGVELLMKEILTKNNPFLIFEDLRDAASKQKQADQVGVGIFFLEKPPKTVTYEEAVKRVSAFIKPTELTDNLQADLDKLNRFRNQLEHYAIEVDKEDVVQLLAALHGPLLELFEKQLGQVRKQQPAKVTQTWAKVQKLAESYSELEKEVLDVVSHFNGQIVPGHLFNVREDVTLPTFQNVLPYHRTMAEGRQYGVDIFGEAPGVHWAIEIKSALEESLGVIAQISSVSRALGAQGWLIVATELDDMAKSVAHTYGVLITGAKEWKELKNLVIADSHNMSNLKDAG